MEDITPMCKTGQNFAVTLKIHLCVNGKKKKTKEEKKACSHIPVYIYQS